MEEKEYIYSRESKGYTGLGPYCAQTGVAGCPGDGPDVRGFRRGRMSGLGAGCPGWRVKLLDVL